uniref:Uncharacterized protein n=1 Tax=Strombidium inclinatum TaxID=197538 RepID=A0A7S3ILB6_9SPIT
MRRRLDGEQVLVIPPVAGARLVEEAELCFSEVHFLRGLQVNEARYHLLALGRRRLLFFRMRRPQRIEGEAFYSLRRRARGLLALDIQPLRALLYNDRAQLTSFCQQLEGRI